jgi:hypothetical protein
LRKAHEGSNAPAAALQAHDTFRVIEFLLPQLPSSGVLIVIVMMVAEIGMVTARKGLSDMLISIFEQVEDLDI